MITSRLQACCRAATVAAAMCQPPAMAQSPGLARLTLTESELVFENLQHDFAHRPVCRLERPDTPEPRIEGQRNGALRVIDFVPRRLENRDPSLR